MNPRTTPAIQITYSDEKRTFSIHASSPSNSLSVDLLSSQSTFAINVTNNSNSYHENELADFSGSETNSNQLPSRSFFPASDLSGVVFDLHTDNNLSEVQASANNSTIIELEPELSEIVIENPENQPLIPPPTPPLATPTLLSRALQLLRNAGLYMAAHPFAAPIAIITAAPSAANAFLASSAKNPDHLVNAWQEMDLQTKFLSLGNAFISEAINGLMNLFFIVSAKEKLLDGFKHMFDSPGDFVEFTLSLALALASAVAAGIISYETFIATGAAIAASVASVSALVTAASRFLWTKNTIKRGRNIFDKDAQLQTEFADFIKHFDASSLSSDDLTQLRNDLYAIIGQITLATKPDKMTENAFRHAQYEKFAPQLAQLFAELQALHPDLVIEKKSAEYIADYASLFFDVGLAVAITIPAYLSYLQKGFDGFNYLSQLIAKKDLTVLDIVIKRWIGFLSGVASAAGYFLSGLEVRETLTDLIKDMYQQPINIAKNLTFIAANGITGTSMYNISSNILRKPDNIIGMDTDSLLATPYTGSSFAGGAMVNLVSSAKKAYPDKVPALPDFCDVEKGLDLNGLLHSAQKHYSKKDFKISRETGEALRNTGLFSQSRTTPSVSPEETISVRPTSAALV